LVLILAACAAFGFAAFSTYDFVAHLDRQVHGIHCSFLPGLTDASGTDSAGCQATLMSAYSSVMRDSIWGGIPISLAAMSVFAFLIFWGAFLVLGDRQSDPRAARFTLLATLLPVGASLVMGYISLHELEAACKLCIGIYISSTIAFLAALGLVAYANRESRIFAGERTEGGGREPMSLASLGLAFALGVAFVAVPVASYAAGAPDFSSYIGSCGELEYATDERVLVPLGDQSDGLEMVEVLDPLCPSCRGFESRFAQMDARHELRRSAILFPLDSACNWMIDDSIHPGACAISEAMLCAGEGAEAVLAWSFENQEAIMEAEKAGEGAAARMVTTQFPELAGCVGSPRAQAKLNLALRWAVKNRILVLTPQVYVEGLRLCDEDTDLGLDYALPRLIARARTRPPREPEPEPVKELPALARAPRPRQADAEAANAPRPQAPPAAEAAPDPDGEPGAAPAPDGEAEGQPGSAPDGEPGSDANPERVAKPAPVPAPDPEAGADSDPEAEPAAPPTQAAAPKPAAEPAAPPPPPEPPASPAPEEAP
jgi:uncharacterized membrane protein